MSKSNVKHTPGPWTLEQNEIDLVRVRGPKHGIALTDRANAHLIAAAPEMLEALESAYAELAQWLDNPSADISTGKALDKIADVIAKAKGEA